MIIKKTPFSENIRSFIYANNLTRQEFADLLNEELDNMRHETRYYMANDIWTYDSRGSFPKDGNVLVAIAHVLDFPLEDILTHYIDREQLKRPITLQEVRSECYEERSLSPRILRAFSNKLSRKDVLQLLTTEEREVFQKLMLVAQDEKNGYEAYFDIALRYENREKAVATIRIGEGILSLEKTFEWDLKEYVERIMLFDFNEEFVLELQLLDVLFEKFVDAGIINDFYCSEYEPDEPYDGEKYFVATAKLNVTPDELDENYEYHINLVRQKLKELKGENE